MPEISFQKYLESEHISEGFAALADYYLNLKIKFKKFFFLTTENLLTL